MADFDGKWEEVSFVGVELSAQITENLLFPLNPYWFSDSMTSVSLSRGHAAAASRKILDYISVSPNLHHSEHGLAKRIRETRTEGNKFRYEDCSGDLTHA